MLLVHAPRLRDSAAFGLALAVGVTAAAELLDGSASAAVFFGSVAALGLVSLLGPRAPLSLRVAFTALAGYLAFNGALVGRTMEPGLSVYTIGMACYCALLLGGLPTLALLAVWRGTPRVWLTLALLPAALALACGVAHLEERWFVAQHPQGAPMTARATVSHHWLAYEPGRRGLYGSD